MNTEPQLKIASSKLHPRYGNLLKSCSKVFDLRIYDGSIPIFDFLDQVKPDVFFLDRVYVTDVVRMACNEIAGKTKIALFSDDVPEGMDFHLLCTTKQVGDVYLKNLNNIGIDAHCINDYGYVQDFWDQADNENFSSDVGYYFSQKESETMNKQISTNPDMLYSYLKILNEISEVGKLKIVGNHKTLPIPQFLGMIDEKQIFPFLNSSKICLDVFGQNVLDQAVNGVFTLSFVKNKLFPTVDMKSTSSQIAYYLDNNDLREKTAKEAQKKIIKNDMCYHRLSEIFDKLGAKSHQDTVSKKIKEIQCKLES